MAGCARCHHLRGTRCVEYRLIPWEAAKSWMEKWLWATDRGGRWNQRWKMESRLFTTILDDSTSESALAFTRHLEELLQLSSDAREACLKALYKFRLARTKRQTRELIDAIADGQGVPAAAIQHSLSILGFLVDALLNESIPDDDHTLWAEDLDSEWGISGDDRQVFESVFLH